MNSRLGWFLAIAAGPFFSSLAITVNDGTSASNLVKLSNANGGGSAVAMLDVNTNGYLVAAQMNTSSDFALRTVWYASGVVATGGVYTVTADFLPAAKSYANRGGVIGWLSVTTSNGIALQVTPEDINQFPPPTTFRVSVIDFSANSDHANDGFDHLFNKDGTPASEDFVSALSVATNYSATDFATFQLAFTAPTAADQVALTNRATAHITAKVLQSTNVGSAPIKAAPAIDLLTDLPLPAAAVHRFGYFAVWGDIFLPEGGVIGYLDNLNAEGGVGAAPNLPPAVSISSPTAGATFMEPASIPIVADATDSDGTVARVDFFAGATLLGTATATNNQFNFTWSGVRAGTYSLTAQATDNLGATSASAPVSITVSPSTGGPTLTIVRTNNTIELSWLFSGYQLQMKTNLSSPTWTDVPDTVNTNRVTLPASSGNMFFRLLQGGPPGGPKLTIQVVANSVTISWPAQQTSYRLQAKVSLSSATWTDIATSGNQFTESPGGASKFYRLISP